MGIAAYNRGSLAIRREIAKNDRPVEFEIIENLNNLPKYEDAGTPLQGITFAFDGMRWWALDPVKLWAGFGYYYPSLREAVKRWRVEITGYNGMFLAEPRREAVQP